MDQVQQTQHDLLDTKDEEITPDLNRSSSSSSSSSSSPTRIDPVVEALIKTNKIESERMRDFITKTEETKRQILRERAMEEKKKREEQDDDDDDDEEILQKGYSSYFKSTFFGIIGVFLGGLLSYFLMRQPSSSIEPEKELQPEKLTASSDEFIKRTNI